MGVIHEHRGTKGEEGSSRTTKKTESKISTSEGHSGLTEETGVCTCAGDSMEDQVMRSS